MRAYDQRQNSQAFEQIKWTLLGSIEALQLHLTELNSSGIIVLGVPNERLMHDAVLMRNQKQPSYLHIDTLNEFATKRGWLLQSRISDNPFCMDLCFSLSPCTWLPTPSLLPASSEPLLPLVRQALVDDIQTTLRNKLPEFMLPHSILILPELPLTLHGKIDVNALPDPSVFKLDQEAFKSHLLSDNEAILKSIWEEILGLAPIGVNENFFDLGGDSILAIQVVNRAARKGLNLTPKKVFKHLTIAELALVSEPESQSIKSSFSIGSSLLAPAQAAFFARELTNPNHWNQAIRVNGALLSEPLKVQSAINQVVGAQDVCRLRFSKGVDGAWTPTFVSTATEIKVDLLDEDASMEAVADRLHQQLSIEHGPLLRAALKTGEHAELVIVAHHLIIDIVSWQVLLSDLEHVLSVDTTIELPRPAANYSDWIESLSQSAHSLKPREHIAYWLSQSRVSDLHPIAGRDTGKAPDPVRLEQRLPGEIAKTLLSVASGQDIESHLVAALLVSLAEVTGRHDVVVKAETHGRDAIEDLDLSRVMGWFSIEYPVRLRLPHGCADQDVVPSIAQEFNLARRRAATYAQLAYFDPDKTIREKLTSSFNAEIGFNYFGRQQACHDTSNLLQKVNASTGSLTGNENKAEFAVEFNAYFYGDDLYIYWNIDRALIDEKVVADINDYFPTALSRLINIVGYSSTNNDAVNAGDLDLIEINAAINEVL